MIAQATDTKQVRPRVSIGLPIYNGGKFVRVALDRIAAQTFRDYELVIVDNGSTDATAQICQEYAKRDPRIRYIRFETTISAVANFWRVFQHARGDYFLWNAADDERPPTAIAEAVSALDSNPRAAMVHGPVQLFLPKNGHVLLVDNRMPLNQSSPAARVAAFVRGLRHNGMLYGVYRRTALERATFHQHPGHDSLLCMQMAMVGEIDYVESPLIVYRHVYGATHDPMYDWVPLTLLDVAIYRGSRRWKCWITLGKGVRLLAREQQTPALARLGVVSSFVTAFARRYRRHLLTETAFAVTYPIALVVRPFVRMASRVKRTVMNAGLPAA